MIPRRTRGDAGDEHLFVYGTLRRGARMHALLAGAARPLGPATFRGRLYHLGGYPGAVASPDSGDVVRGELYALDGRDADRLLARLDRYEGPDFERVRAEVRSDGPVSSWIYLVRTSVEGRPRIVSGDYLGEDDVSRVG
jgi:gamma-glutamylcyclotransferase (GGCT)/AIG2-like uncharacterized protein YtfP